MSARSSAQERDLQSAGARTGPNPWVVVAVAFAALALSFAFRAVIGIAMPSWEASLGWTRDVISGYGALALVLMAFLFPLVGMIVDRLGARGVLVVGLIAMTIAMGLIATMTSPWQLALGYGLIGGIAFTLVGNTVVTVMVARAFEARRGLATGIATSGATGGQFIFVPLLTVAFASIGWRTSFGIAAAICFGLAVLTFIVLRGESPARPAAATPAQRSAGALRAFLRDPGFHALAASFFVCGVTTTGVIETHLLPFAALCGFAALPSALAYSLMSGCNLFGMMACGWLCDRYNRSHILGVIYAVRAASFLILLVIGSDYTLLIVFAIVFGTFEFATLPATAGLTAARYGVANLGKVMGFLMMAHSLGAALGAYAGGRIFVQFGNYDAAWIGSALGALVAALVVFAATDPRHSRPSAGRGAPATA